MGFARRRLFVRLWLLLPVFLACVTACDQEQSPVEVTRSFMLALETFDVSTAESLVCQEQRARVRDSIKPAGDEAFVIQFEALSFQERDNDGQTAVVQVGGRVTISFLGQQETQEINEEHVVVKRDGRWMVCDP